VCIREGDEWKIAFKTPRGHYEYLVFSRSAEEHVQHVRMVLQRLLENRLYLKVEKCTNPSAEFLGLIVEGGLTRPDPRKIRTVVE